MATDSTRDLLMLRPRLMLLSLAMVLMDMLPLLPPMLLLLPSPLDMLDMDMELESGRDLLIPKLMLVTSVDTAAMEATAMEAMVDIEAMELMAADSTRDLLMLRLMLLSSMDLMAMLPLLPLMDAVSAPVVSSYAVASPYRYGGYGGYGYGRFGAYW